jgi:preprotein translocase subunit SecE
VARDRQRAKARKQRRAQKPGSKPTETHRSNVPGELDHASANADQFESAIVAGAGGEPIADEHEVEVEEERDATAEEVYGGVDEPVEEERLGPGAGAIATTTERATEPAGRGGNRFIGFLRASWAELQRVQWPDRRQVAQATAVVLGFVVIAGAYLGLADALAQRVVDFIL